MTDFVKEALAAEKAMNKALKEAKLKSKKQQPTPKAPVVAEQI